MFKEFHHQTRGRSHVAEGVPCQDSTAYHNRNGIQVLCLADGAGSAAKSEHGARALVNVGGKFLADNFADFTMRDDGAQVKLEIIRRLLHRLEQLARKRECRVKDLASTFLAVAASEDRFIAVHVGDGVIGYLKNGELKVLSAPDNDEFANQTTFVTSETAAGSMRLLRGSLEGVSGFVLMSDGPADSLFDHRTKELAVACSKIINAVGTGPKLPLKHPSYKRQLRRLLETTIRDTTKDDCSIGILARRLPAAVDA